MISEEMQNKIKEKNKSLGIKTYFYYGELEILGYSEGDAIYINLNENTDETIERTNDHEILHFFEETEEFEQYKNEVVKRKDIEKLREEYKLKYYGIYSEEEIEAGVIDTEIAIDRIIEEGEQEQFFDLERKTIEERRYLRLDIRNNIEGIYDLSKWEKIFAENYYESKKSFKNRKSSKHAKWKRKSRRNKSRYKRRIASIV